MLAVAPQIWAREDRADNGRECAEAGSSPSAIKDDVTDDTVAVYIQGNVHSLYATLSPLSIQLILQERLAAYYRKFPCFRSSSDHTLSRYI